MILEKSFGEKINGVQYKDRVGAYAILVADDKDRKLLWQYVFRTSSMGCSSSFYDVRLQ